MLITATTQHGNGPSDTCEANMPAMLKNKALVAKHAEDSLVIAIQGVMRRGIAKNLSHDEIQARVDDFVNRAIGYQSNLAAEVAEIQAKLDEATAKLAAYEAENAEDAA